MGFVQIHQARTLSTREPISKLEHAPTMYQVVNCPVPCSPCLTQVPIFELHYLCNRSSIFIAALLSSYAATSLQGWSRSSRLEIKSTSRRRNDQSSKQPNDGPSAVINHRINKIRRWTVQCCNNQQKESVVGWVDGSLIMVVSVGTSAQ